MWSPTASLRFKKTTPPTASQGFKNYAANSFNHHDAAQYENDFLYVETLRRSFQIQSYVANQHLSAHYITQRFPASSHFSMNLPMQLFKIFAMLAFALTSVAKPTPTAVVVTNPPTVQTRLAPRSLYSLTTTANYQSSCSYCVFGSGKFQLPLTEWIPEPKTNHVPSSRQNHSNGM